MIQCRIMCCLIPVLLLAAPVRGEDKPSILFSGESRAAALRLAEARKRLDEHKWSEAIEELQAILNSAGNDLVPVAPDHRVRASRLCQIQLASLPPDALRLYRQRYENQARKRLHQAQAEGDLLQLRKLVEDAFCTRAAEKAIDLLGDLAFERGCFEEAEEWWRLLAPLPDARRDAVTHGLVLVYPDLSLDPARVQAKQLLARLFQGADDDWSTALESYRQRHAKAEGTLAGRKGRYADLLQALADELRNSRRGREEEATAFPALPHGRGSARDCEEVLDRLSALCRDGPTWSFNLEQRRRQEEAAHAPPVNAAQARTLAFYPVIVGHRVLVADARYVTAFDLRNGQSEEWYDVARTNGGVQPNLTLPAPPDLRYALTVAGDSVYVRLGAQDIGMAAPPPERRFGSPPPRRDDETFLACLGLQPDDKGEHFRWHIRGIAHDHALFEGAPLVADGLIWIASVRYKGNRCLTAIDCYPAENAGEPPLRWRCDVCETHEVKSGEPRYRHHLLTLAGTQVVYCTHSGAVVAIDALTGQRNWAIRYPRRTLDGQEAELRDLAPVLFAGGRLYVAPADSDTLLCLDPATGRTLWEWAPLRVVHLLGLGQGRLIFTTPTGLRAVQADSGRPVWAVPDVGSLTPAGRGLLIGDVVLFPTTQVRNADAPWVEGVVYVLRQSDGRPADDPAKLHRLPAGNLAYAHGILAVADRQTLSVFVPPRLLLEERKREAQRRPRSATAWLQLARAEADAARDEEALQALRRAEALLRREPKTGTVKKLQEQSFIVTQQVLLRMAQRAAAEARWQDAENTLAQATQLPLPPRYRLHALLRAAQIWHEVNQSDRANKIWGSIRAEEQLRQIPVVAKNGKPGSAALYLDSGAPGRAGTSQEQPFRSAKATALAASQTLPLFRTWHVRLDRGERPLAGWRACDPEVLLTGSADGRLNCRLMSTGESCWTQRLPFAPCWAGCHADRVLCAGAEGAACLHRGTGRPLWHFPAPVSGRSAHACREEVRVVLDPQPPGPLTAFRLAAGRLFFLQDQRRLFALDVESGAVLWDRWAPDAQLHLPFPQGCFSPCYHAGAATVLIQTAGRRWLLEAATGRTIHQAADNRDLWQQAPLKLEDRTLCLTPDNRQIMLLDARSGRCLWTHRLAGVTTPSGEMPLVQGRGPVLLCVQPVNIGYLLQRLDCASGEAMWPQPQLLAAKRLERGAWDFDADAVYTIEDRFLVARSLTDGKPLWRRTLPFADGRVRRVGDFLAVWPQALGAVVRFRFRSLLGTVQWDLGPLGAPEAVFPVSCYDPKTGQLAQRLNFRLASPLRTMLTKRSPWEDGERAWIVRTSSLLADEEGLVIRLDAPQPFVALGGEIWGLNSEAPPPPVGRDDGSRLTPNGSPCCEDTIHRCQTFAAKLVD